jgi:hypothetical protein
MPSLSELVGEEIALELVTPFIRSTDESGKPPRVKLVAVEAAGIWVEYLETTEILVDAVGAMPKTPVFFFPFSQVRRIFMMGDLVALSEKAYGV